MAPPRKYPDTLEGREARGVARRARYHDPATKRARLVHRNALQREKYARDPVYRAAVKGAAARHKSRNPHFQKQASDRTYKHRFGITRVQRAEIVAKQGGCGLCGATSPGRAVQWHTDHDHETGRMRGIVCGSCNSALGGHEKLARSVGLPATQSYLDGWPPAEDMSALRVL